MQSLAIITSTAIDSGSNGRNSISRMSSSGAPRSGPISGFNSVLAGSTASVLSRVQMALLDPDGDYDLWVDEDDEESWESDIDIDAVLPLPQGTVLAPASPDAAAAAATVAASAEGKSSLTSPASKRANGGKGSPAVGQDGDTKIKRMTSTGKPLRKMSTKRKRSVKKRVGGTSGSSLPAGTPAGGIANTSSTTIGDGLPSKPAINAASRALAGSKQARSSVLVTAFRGTQSMMRRAMVLFPQHGRVSPMVDDASILSPPETLNSSHMGGSVTHDEHRHTDLSGSKGSSFTGNIASQTLQSSVGVNIHPPDMPSQLPSSAPSHAQFDTHLDGTLTSQINPSTLYFGGISPIREEASRSTTKSGTPDAPMGALFGRDVNAGGAGRQPPTVNAGPVARRTGTSQQDAAVEITPSEQETMPSQPSVPAPAKRTIWNLFGLLSFFGGSKQDKSLKQAAKTPPGKPLLGAARIAPADLEAKQPLPTVAAPTPAMQSTHTSVHGRHHSQTPAARPASLHGRRPSGASPLSGVPILATPFNSDDSDNQFMGMDSTDASNTNIDANADRKGSMSNRRSTTDKHVPKIDVIFPTSLPYASGSALPPPPAISTYFNTHLGTSASQGDTFPRQSTYSMMDGGYIATQTDPSAFPSCNTLLVESTTTGFSRSTGRSSAFEGQYLGHHLPQQHPQQHLSQGTFGSSIGFQGHQLGGPPPNTPLQPLSRPASSMLQGQGSWNQKQFQGQRSRPSQHRRSQSAMSSKSDLAKQRMDIYPLVAAAFGLTSQVLGQPPSPMQVSPQQMSAMPIQTKGTQGPQSASAGQPPGQQGGRVSVASAHPPTIQTQLQQSQQQQPSPSSPISHTAPIVSYDTRSYSGPRASVAASEGRGRKMSLTSSINSTNDSGLIRSILKSNPDAHVVEHRYTEDTLPSDSMEGMHAQFGWVG
ncbi:hypothetical protein BC831DRAFT_484416 [Entophlyctis helioformis]|nr:hypothetical protein BC831DRAFT_484416 [Entophlyctis helioformis]